MTEIEKIVRQELSNLLKIDAIKISKDEDLTKMAQWDSLSVLELLDMAEEKFTVLIPPEKLIEIKTINDIVNIIKENKK